MVSSWEKLEYMQTAPNQEPVDHLKAWIASQNASQRSFGLLEALANLPLSPGNNLSVLDRSLEILSAQYYEDRESRWACELRPWACRRLSYAVGSAFTRAFCTKLRIPFDGCYSNTNIIGIAEEFLVEFSIYEEMIIIGDSRSRGALIPANIKELVFYQDPLSASAGYGVRNDAAASTEYNLRKRLAEDKEEGKMLTVTPKRSRLYEKLCEEAREAYIDKKLVYDDAKVAMIWVGIIDVLRLLPNLETFRWLSDAVVMKTFLGAISHYCLNIRVLEFHLSQPFGTKDAALQAWNRTYQNEQTGTFYKSPVILDKPVIAFRSSYLSDPPENRQTKKFPTTCHTSVRLYLKSDEDLPITLDTIAFYSPHLQSLVIDRSKSLPGLGIEDKGEHERMARCLRPPQYSILGTSHLSLISISTAAGLHIMGAISPPSIQSLELKGCKAVRHIYKQLVRDVNVLRKFKITFPSSDEAKERAYSYWKYHVAQMRETLDFLRAGTFALDELEIQGDFGVPTPHPVEASGLTPDLLFAISAQAASLVRLRVVNTNIDFSFEELATIVCKAKRLTQLAVTCRAFEYKDIAGNLVYQGLGTYKVLEAFLSLLNGRQDPFSLTLLRTHYHPLDERTVTRDAAGREIVLVRKAGILADAVKESIRAGGPLVHLGIYFENKINMYAIFAAQDADLVMVRANDGMEMERPWQLYEEFEEWNNEFIEQLGVPQPPGINFTQQGAVQSPVPNWPSVD